MLQVLNNHACLQAVVSKRLHGKAAVLQQIMFKKQQKHVQKHCVYIMTNYIMCASQFCVT